MQKLFDTYNTWSAKRILRHVIYWFCWSCLYILANYILKSYKPISTWASFELVVLPIKIICSYTIAFWLMPKYLYVKRYKAFIILSLITLCVCGFLLFLVYYNIVYPIILDFDAKHGSKAEFIFKAIELLHITSLVVCIKFFQNMLYQERKNNELQMEKTSAELKYLKNQIQPHFLFNTLNNLYGMVLSKNDNAAKSIVKLSDLLSYMIYENDSDFVPIENEIKHLENYIDLEKLRYNRKLNLTFSKSGDFDNYTIAPLILLPFVENAFKHGPGNDEGMSNINISLDIKNKILDFKVINSFVENDDVGRYSGVGLSNVKKRLNILYPNKHTLEIKKENVFKIHLKLHL